MAKPACAAKPGCTALPNPETTHARSPSGQYLEALGVADTCEEVQAGTDTGIGALQARLAGDASGDDAWVSWCVEHAYRLPVAQPQSALMPSLKPLQRQHMTPRVLHRSFGRQLLGLFVYRPAARLLRGLQILSGRVERT